MSSLQLLEPRHGRDVERREVAPQVAVVARHGDHRRVVGRELELRKERSPAAPAARFGDAVAQARVGRDAARDGDVAGGVSANSGLRNGIVEEGRRRGWRTFLPEFKFTTDNAAMIAMAGYYRYQHGDFSSLGVSPVARLQQL